MKTDAQESSFHGAWLRLDDLEDAAAAKLSEQLGPFEAPFRDTYEAGIIALVLRAEALTKTDVRCAANGNDYWAPHPNVNMKRGASTQSVAIWRAFVGRQIALQGVRSICIRCGIAA